MNGLDMDCPKSHRSLEKMEDVSTVVQKTTGPVTALIQSAKMAENGADADTVVEEGVGKYVDTVVAAVQRSNLL